MDAAHKLCKNKALLPVALALMVAAPGLAQTPAFSLGTTQLSLNQSVLSGSVSVNSSNSTAITFTAAISGLSANGGNGAWLALSPGSAGSLVTPANVSVQIANTAGMVAGTYSATVTLTPSAPAGVTATTFTVSWANGSGGGGGGGGIISLSQSSLPLTAAAGFTAFGNVTVSTTSATNVSLGTPSVVTNNCGSTWLSASLNTFTINNLSSANLNVSASAAGLTSATCTGTVTITPGTGAAVSVTVTFTVGGGGGGGTGSLTISPLSFGLSYTTGSAFGSITQSLTVTDPGATSIAATSNATWLLINNQTSVNTTPGVAFTASLSSIATGLSTGQYTGNINFTDNLNNTATVTVTLTVNGGSSSGLTVTPSSLTFNSAVGGAQQVSNLAVTSTSGGSFSTSVSTSWISATVSTGTLASNTQGTVTVTVNPGSLATGTYNGSVTVFVGGQSLAVPVTMNIGNSGGTSNSSVAPSTIQLAWQVGSGAGFVNRPQIEITGTTGNWSSTVSTAQGSGWLSLSPSSGSSLPAAATVVVDPTGLTAGSYSGTITLTTPGGTQSVTVSLAVSAGAVLNAQPGSLIFNYQTGGTTPPGQSVFFSTADTTAFSTLDITNTVTANAPWISVQTFEKSIQVFVDPSGLTGGLYSGSVTIAPAGVASLTLPVVLVINSGTGGGSAGPFTFTPASVLLTAAVGSNAGSQTLQIASTVATTFTVSSNQTWLTVTPTSGTAPTSVTVGAASSNLPAGTYNGTLTFTSGGSTVQSVSVSLTVTGSGGGGGGNPGNVTVSPASLTFTAKTGEGVLPVQALQVSSASGTAPVSFTTTVTTTSGSTWLSTSAGSAQQNTPMQMTVTVDTTNLAAGTYQGNIKISPTGGTAVNVPVTLTLTPPNSVAATPTTLTFSYRGGANTPAAQTIAVSSTGSAALAFTAAAASTGNWLAVSPASGTTPLNLAATVNPTGLTAGTYNGTITVAGSGGAPGSTTINVTLTVTVPLPTITQVTNAASYATGSISPGEIITLFGTDLGPATPAGLALDGTGKVSTALAGVQVLVNGYPSPMIYASNTQISAVVPYEVAQFASANVLVKYLGQTSNGIATPVTTTVPGLFTQNASGTGPGAILNQNASVNSPANPAARGDIVVVYMTGEGQTSPAGVTGKVTTVSAAPPLTPAPLLPISILIGGQPATYSFAGEAPGFVSGVMQLNLTIPQATASGAQSIVVSIGGHQSQTGVTVSIR